MKTTMFVFGIFMVYMTGHCLANEEARLVGDLLKQYNPMVRPLFNHSDVLKVDLGAQLLNLEWNPETRKLVQTGWPRIEWTDDFLKWDPQNYGGVNALRLPIQKIWRPDITMFNGMAPPERFTNTLAIVYNEGRVLWIPPMRMTSLCPDRDDDEDEDGDSSSDKKTRRCVMIMGSWAYSSDELDLGLYADTETVDLTDYMGELEIVDSKVERVVKQYSCCTDTYPQIKITLKFKTEED